MNITPVIQAAAVLIAAIYFVAIKPYLRTKTTKEQQEVINNWVRVAVKAAEQIYAGAGRGEEKKAFVLRWLEDHEIEMDESVVDAIIESAVHELNAGLI